jgi:hypothetical protein
MQPMCAKFAFFERSIPPGSLRIGPEYGMLTDMRLPEDNSMEKKDVIEFFDRLAPPLGRGYD